jgi:hypothetical protein
MITITSNISFVIGSMLSKFADIENPEYVSRAVATALMPEIRERIHERGENSNGQQIGTYSNSYLRLRERKYNRTSDRDVVASLTRQLENSYVLAPQQKSYTIENLGNKIPNDTKTKTDYLEERFGPIWQLTERERLAALEVASIEAQLILDKK